MLPGLIPGGAGLLPAASPATTPLLATGTAGDPVARHCQNRVARDAIVADRLEDRFAK